jgi:3-hydroxyacyl-CoA dehydrogenase
MLPEAVENRERLPALVIANEGEHFCVGANLFEVVMAAKAGKWDEPAEMVKGYQAAVQRMKYSRVPVVSRPTA